MIGSLIRRFIASESGQLVLVGAGIAALMGFFWLTRSLSLPPWSDYILPALFAAVLLGAGIFAVLRARRSGGVWSSFRVAFAAAPVSTSLNVLQVLLAIAFVVAALAPLVTGGAPPSDVRRNSAQGVMLLLLTLGMVRDVLDRRRAKASGSVAP